MNIPGWNDHIRLFSNDTTIEVGLIIPEKRFKIKGGTDYYWFKSDTILATREGFNGKLLHGRYTKSFPNRNLFKEGRFEFGVITGVWREWYDNGQLKCVSKYRGGKKAGMYVEYLIDGKVKEEGEFNNDQFTGKIFQYDENGNVQVVRFKDGEQVKFKSNKQERIKNVKQEEVDLKNE